MKLYPSSRYGKYARYPCWSKAENAASLLQGLF